MKSLTITIVYLLTSICAQAGAHYYEGGAFFVTGLNRDLLSKETVKAEFAVKPPAMMCGILGVKTAEIRNLSDSSRVKAKKYLKKEYGPALAVFFSAKRSKLFDEYPNLGLKDHHSPEKLPDLLVLGDSETEDYEFGILTGQGFFVFKGDEFVRSFLKDYNFQLYGLHSYIEYLQDLRKPFYPRRWNCVNFTP